MLDFHRRTHVVHPGTLPFHSGHQMVPYFVPWVKPVVVPMVYFDPLQSQNLPVLRQQLLVFLAQ